MPSYQILSKEDPKVTVKLTADNGYSEVQSYIPPEGVTEEDCLEAATKNFNDGIMAQQTMPEAPQVYPIVEVK